jgi:hypothetical protein
MYEACNFTLRMDRCKKVNTNLNYPPSVPALCQCAYGREEMDGVEEVYYSFDVMECVVVLRSEMQFVLSVS